MSSDLAIKVESLSKCYHIYDQPADRLKQMINPRLQKLSGQQPKQYFREFWALNDVSFEVKKGETVGIIGRNGSGKSTLLQMICGTLNPTSGSIQTNGRIAALLELGSGFNPEFTGIENVYLNASVLGLAKDEIDNRYDDIVSFADIGEFIDQPVKTYSSGMMVRLAFAVIANVSADILVVDEALSVGDAIFTQKCMRFIRKFRETGALLFVSHDSGSVLSLCQRAIWLSNGVVAEKGPAKEVVEKYTQYVQQEIIGQNFRLEKLEPLHNASKPNENEVDNIGIDNVIDKNTVATFFSQIENSSGWKTGKADIVSVRITDDIGNEMPIMHGGEEVSLEIIARANTDIYSPILGWFLMDRLGQTLFGEHTYTYIKLPKDVHAGEKIKGTFKFRLPMLPNGDYAMTVSIAEGDIVNHVQHHWLHNALIIKVASDKLRYGLVGIAFNSVSLDIVK